MSKVAKTSKKKNVTAGIAFIHATFNNTTVTITDLRGDTLCWASGGTCGFKGSRKGTPFAGQCAAQQAAEKAAKFGVKDLGSSEGAGKWPRKRHHRPDRRRHEREEHRRHHSVAA